MVLLLAPFRDGLGTKLSLFKGHCPVISCCTAVVRFLHVFLRQYIKTRAIKAFSAQLLLPTNIADRRPKVGSVNVHYRLFK